MKEDLYSYAKEAFQLDQEAHNRLMELATEEKVTVKNYQSNPENWGHMITLSPCVFKWRKEVSFDQFYQGRLALCYWDCGCQQGESWACWSQGGREEDYHPHSAGWPTAFSFDIMSMVMNITYYEILTKRKLRLVSPGSQWAWRLCLSFIN